MNSEENSCLSYLHCDTFQDSEFTGTDEDKRETSGTETVNLFRPKGRSTTLESTGSDSWVSRLRSVPVVSVNKLGVDYESWDDCGLPDT